MKDNVKKNEMKYVGIGIAVFFIYMFLPSFQTIPLDLFNVDITNMPLYLKVIYMIIFEIILMSIIIYIFRNKLKDDISNIKENHKVYFSKYLKIWILSVGIMMISNLLISVVLPDTLPSNEEALRALFDKSPIYIFFSAVIFAPIVEELVFRQGFRYIFKTKWLFILMAGLIFGALHVLSSAESFTELLYIIPYSAPGIAFAYILTKTENILVTIGFHFMHNGILIALQFLLMILA
jgi:hypothetical protein